MIIPKQYPRINNKKYEELSSAYISRCERFGWKPSVRGFINFACQVSIGHRDPITFGMFE